jgi:hypothetical protein
VAPKTAGAHQTLKRDDSNAGRVRKKCGLGWITLKGKEAEERRLACLTETSGIDTLSCEKQTSRPGRNRLVNRHSNRISLKSTNRGAEMQRTGLIRRPFKTKPR